MGFDGVEEEIQMSGYDVIGANARGNRPAATRRPAPRLVANAAKIHPYHAAGKAAVSAVRANAAGMRAARPSKRVFKEIAVHGILGDGCAVLGVAGNVPVKTNKPLTVKQKAAVDKYNQAVAKTKKTADAAKKAGDNAVAIAKKVSADVKNASGAVRALMAKQTKMHGESVACMDVSEEAVEGYCALTGTDAVTVYGALDAQGIYVHGFDLEKLHAYDVLGAEVCAEAARASQVASAADAA